MTKDELIEELQEMLAGAMEMAESITAAAERRRVLEIKAVTSNLLMERLNEQQELGKRLKALNGGMTNLQATVANLPKPQRDTIATQINELSALVKQSLDGGPLRPSALSELEGWLLLREGHASDKKVRTDGNRIRDFIDFAGDKPVNAYRYSDFQRFANAIRSNLIKAAFCLMDTGERLARWRDVLPHGAWLPWVESEAGMSAQSARDAINVFLRFQDIPLWLEDLNLALPQTAIVRLSTAPNAAFEDVHNRLIQGEKLRVADVDAIVKRYRRLEKGQDEDGEP